MTQYTVYIKRDIKKGGLPKKSGLYFVIYLNGHREELGFYSEENNFVFGTDKLNHLIESWLEEITITLPEDGEIEEGMFMDSNSDSNFMEGQKHMRDQIINQLK